MHCITQLCLILCTISLIKAVSLKIDGLINLGDKWNYEYRILRTETNNTRSQTDTEGDRMQREEKRLSALEHMLRQQLEKKRKKMRHSEKERQHIMDHNARTDKKKHIKVSVKPAIYKTKKPREVNEKKSLHTAKVKDNYSSDEDSSFDNDSPKIRTMAIYEDMTKKPKEGLRRHSESEETTKQRDSSERSTSWNDKTRNDATDDDDTKSSSDDSVENTILIGNNNYIMHPRAPQGLRNATQEGAYNGTTEGLSSIVQNTTTHLPTTRAPVTTVRTENIYTDAHSVKDDDKVTDFTYHLYKQTLNLFDSIKEKTDQDHLKKQLDQLSKTYEDKFKEYIKETSDQKIMTRLGTQKVILNTIDMSNRLLSRLMNVMIGEMDKKGTLRHNAATANIFQKAIEREMKSQLMRACKKFGICRTGPGFSEFLIDILAILLKLEDVKFKQSKDAFTEVVSDMNFKNILESRTEANLKTLVSKVDMQDSALLRPMVLILRNILIFRNKPVIVNNLMTRSDIVNCTLALLEIIDLLDMKIPKNESNALEWSDITNSLEEFADGERSDILEIMTAIMDHIKRNLNGLDRASLKSINKNLNIMIHNY